MCHQMHFLDLQQLDRWLNGCLPQHLHTTFAVVITHARSSTITDLWGSTWQSAWRNVASLASQWLVSAGLLISGTPSRWTFTAPATYPRKKTIQCSSVMYVKPGTTSSWMLLSFSLEFVLVCRYHHCHRYRGHVSLTTACGTASTVSLSLNCIDLTENPTAVRVFNPQKHHFSDFLCSKDIHYDWYVCMYVCMLVSGGPTLMSLQLYTSSVRFAWVHLRLFRCHHCHRYRGHDSLTIACDILYPLFAHFSTVFASA